MLNRLNDLKLFAPAATKPAFLKFNAHQDAALVRARVADTTLKNQMVRLNVAGHWTKNAE